SAIFFGNVYALGCILNLCLNLNSGRMNSLAETTRLDPENRGQLTLFLSVPGKLASQHSAMLPKRSSVSQSSVSAANRSRARFIKTSSSDSRMIDLPDAFFLTNSQLSAIVKWRGVRTYLNRGSLNCCATSGVLSLEQLSDKTISKSSNV